MTSIYYFSWLHGLLWLSWVVSQLQVLSLQSLTQLHSAGSLAGATLRWPHCQKALSVYVSLSIFIAGCLVSKGRKQKLPVRLTGLRILSQDDIAATYIEQDKWQGQPDLLVGGGGREIVEELLVTVFGCCLWKIFIVTSGIHLKKWPYIWTT